MKKLILLAVVALLAVGMVGVSSATISDQNSPHNFVGEIWNGTGQICKVCHIPHPMGLTRWNIGDSMDGSGQPTGLLWNRDITTSTFTMYSSATLTPGAINAAPAGISKLCLSCHDGTVALGAFGGGNNDGTTIGTFAGPSRVVVNDMGGGVLSLQGTHPITIDMAIVTDPVNGDPLINDPNTATFANGETVAKNLEGTILQCSTCHDVHDQEAASSPLLRGQINGSGICLTCHIK